MRSVAAGLLIVGSAVLAGCGVDSTEACGRAMAEFGPTLERLAAEIADEGDVLDGLTCDTDGDPVAWLGVDFPYAAQSVGPDEVRARLVESGWERDEQLDDPYFEDEGFAVGEVGYEAIVSTYTEGTVSVTFYSPLWSPDD
ncbi:hypothetical protein [Oerskovia sp. KBS0722]|uniref:hypothetical protein n=1 Tax=Oerskovia sp. KBS0722 TaxID=1179673 RepID=UPI00110E3E81|nr:hypothetical protein [Oerskovia sp. KBS0722]QDW62749.1 hypothetical protein FFI11_009480 [Oerskovia sp. KBS0722]